MTSSLPITLQCFYFRPDIWAPDHRPYEVTVGTYFFIEGKHNVLSIYLQNFSLTKLAEIGIPGTWNLLLVTTPHQTRPVEVSANRFNQLACLCGCSAQIQRLKT